MNGGKHDDTAIELVSKIKFAADELGHAEHSPKEVRRQICQLTQRLVKVLECTEKTIRQAAEKIGANH